MALMILKMSALTLFHVVLTALLWKRMGDRPLDWPGKIGVGVVYGLCAVMSTHLGVDYGHMILNVRDIAPLAAGLLFHPVSGVIAGVIGSVERYIAGTYWNVGAYTRVACSLSTMLAGLLPVLLSTQMFRKEKTDPMQAAFVGMVMEVFHMYVVIITHRDDISMAYFVVKTCSIPMIVFTAIGLTCCCLAVNVIRRDVHALRPKPIRETPLALLFQRTLILVMTVLGVVNFAFSYVIQTQVAEQDARVTLADVASDIRETYERIQETQSGTAEYFKAQALGAARVAATAVQRAGGLDAVDDQLLEGIRENLGLESVSFIEGAEDEWVEMSNRRVTAIVPCGDVSVQVVMNPDETARQLNLSGLKDTLSHFHVGTTGSFDLTRPSGIIVAGERAGMSLTKQELDELLTRADGEYYRGWLSGLEALCRVDVFNDGMRLIVSMPESVIYENRDSQCYENAFADILLVALVYTMINLLVYQLVVGKLEDVNVSLGKITDGNLDEAVNVQSSLEFTTLSHDINQTVGVLKGYIDSAKKRYEQELELARSIQDSALPKNFKFPREDFEIYASMNPAKEVGGDFYDFFFIEGDRLVLVIADVSGKGIPASLFMMRAKQAIRGYAQAGSTPTEILFKANNTLREGNDADMFVTAWIGIMDLTTGSMRCANAGHEYPVLMRAGEDYQVFKDKHGLALAAMEDMHYREYELQFGPGDRLFVYTDGIPEAIDESTQQYGVDRLTEKLNEMKLRSMEETLPAVLLDLRRFAGKAEQFDDITMLGFIYYGFSDGRKQQ